MSALLAFAYCAPIEKPGDYKFSYATNDSAQSEIGSSDGSVRGAYTYIDDTGAVHHVKYVAGPEIGFKVLEDKVDLSEARLSKEFPLAHEVMLVDGFTPEVHAARSAHLSTYNEIKALLPELEEANEEVKIHHLRHEVPATVHRTVVPEEVHSEEPPPVRRPAIQRISVPTVETVPLIDGLTPEDAADREAHIAYLHAIKKLLPMLQEEGEVIIPVHHVHHVHHQGHVQAAPPKITKQHIKITTTPDAHIIEHLHDSPPPIRIIERPVLRPRTSTKVEHVPVVEEKTEDHPLASEIELIEGYTPEVWAERQKFLAHFAAVRSVLPELSEEEKL